MPFRDYRQLEEEDFVLRMVTYRELRRDRTATIVVRDGRPTNM